MTISKSTLGITALGGGGAIEFLQPAVKWVLDGFQAPRPATVDEVVTAATILVVLVVWHAVANRDPALAKDVTEATSAEQPQGVPQP